MSENSIKEPFIHNDNEEKNVVINVDDSDTLNYKPTPLSIKNIKSSIKQTRTNILDKIILPSYYYDVDSIIQARSMYRNGANYSELVSKFLTGISTVIAFAAGAYPEYTYLSFVAGSVGTVAIVTQQLSTYFNKQEKERTQQANKIINLFGLGSIPDLDNDE